MSRAPKTEKSYGKKTSLQPRVGGAVRPIFASNTENGSPAVSLRVGHRNALHRIRHRPVRDSSGGSRFRARRFPPSPSPPTVRTPLPFSHPSSFGRLATPLPPPHRFERSPRRSFPRPVVASPADSARFSIRKPHAVVWPSLLFVTVFVRNRVSDERGKCVSPKRTDRVLQRRSSCFLPRPLERGGVGRSPAEVAFCFRTVRVVHSPDNGRKLRIFFISSPKTARRTAFGIIRLVFFFLN